MTDETWMDAQKALDLGFVDEILSNENPLPIDLIPIQDVALFNCLRNYSKVPAALWQPFTPQDPTSEVVSSEPSLTEDEKREAQSLRDHIHSILRKDNSNG
jgi:hypothetical protein